MIESSNWPIWSFASGNEKKFFFLRNYCSDFLDNKIFVLRDPSFTFFQLLWCLELTTLTTFSFSFHIPRDLAIERSIDVSMTTTTFFSLIQLSLSSSFIISLNRGIISKVIFFARKIKIARIREKWILIKQRRLQKPKKKNHKRQFSDNQPTINFIYKKKLYMNQKKRTKN